MHHHQARLIKDCLRSFSLVERRGLARLVILGLVSMLLRYMTAKTLESKRLVEMLRIDCSGETRVALHVPSSS